MVNGKGLYKLFGLMFFFGIVLFSCEDLFQTDDSNTDDGKVRGCPYIYVQYIYSDRGSFIASYDRNDDYYGELLARHYLLIISFDEALAILTNTYGKPNDVSNLLYTNFQSTPGHLVERYSYTILEEVPHSQLILHRRVVGKEDIAKKWFLAD